MCPPPSHAPPADTAPPNVDTDAFQPPSDVVWSFDDQAKLARWEYVDLELFGDEAILRMTRHNELDEALGR